MTEKLTRSCCCVCRRMSILGSGSDYGSFVAIAGIPCIDVRYTHNYPISSYPLYHSVYETRFLVTQYMDPRFAVRSLNTPLGLKQRTSLLQCDIEVPNQENSPGAISVFLGDLITDWQTQKLLKYWSFSKNIVCSQSINTNALTLTLNRGQHCTLQYKYRVYKIATKTE